MPLRPPLSEQALALVGGATPRPTLTRSPVRPTQRARPSLAEQALAVAAPTAVQAEEPGFFERWAPTGARLAGPIAGGIAGGKAGAAIGALGGPIGAGAGAVIGAVGGGILGEIGAEKMEGRELDALDIALAGGLSAIPAGPAGRAAASLAKTAAETGARNLGKRALLHTAEGAAQGVLEATARPMLKENRAPTFEELGTGAVFGGALGGTLGTGLDVGLSPRPRPSLIDEHIARLDAERAARLEPAPPFPDMARPVDPAAIVNEPAPFELPGTPSPILTPEPPPFMARPRPIDIEPPVMEPAPFPAEPLSPMPAPDVYNPPPVWDRPAPLEFDVPPPELPRTPQEVAADMAMLEAPRLQAEADEAMLAALEAERAQPVSARIPEWEGEVADAARMAREATQAQTSVPPDPRAPVEGYRPAIARQPLEEPDVTFTETTPQPRDADRRQIVEPTSTERRIADRRARLAAELGLPPEHAAVERLHAAEVEARTDPLTGLMNKRGWEELQSTVTPEDHVLVVDMRKLKPINDKLGHGAGDHAIRTFAGVVREVFGDGDAARFGGDEMGAVLRGMNRQQAEQLVETFRQKAANRPTTLRNPQTGETIDIPGFEAHIGVGKSFDEADAAANAAAAASRAGGRGDVPIVPRGSNDPSGNPPVGAAPETPSRGLGDRPPELTPPAEPPRAIAPAGASAPESTVPPPPEAPPKPSGRLFDREAAKARMLERAQRLGRQANSLGSAAAEGPGVLRDAAEIGASYIEDFARRNAGKVPPFESWARTVGTALRGTIENVGKFLRQIYDEAVVLFRGKQPQAAAAPVMPPQVKPAAPAAPKPGPQPAPAAGAPPSKPPSTPPPTEPLGAPKPPGEPPRVETKVEQLAEVAPDAKLSRDKPRTWESLDPAIRTKVEDVTATPEKEAAFYEKARSGKVNDVEVQALDALVAGKRQKYDEARIAFLKAENDGQAGVEYLKAALDKATADLAVAARSDVEAGTRLARALAARARVMKAVSVGDSPDALLRVVMKQIPDLTNAQATELLTVLRERPQDMADALHAAMKPSTLNKWLEAWKNGLVSAPGTQVANVLGNAAEQILRVGETATAAVLDPFFGGPKTRVSGEARFELGGALRGASKSLGRLGQDLKDIATLAPEKIDITAGNFERQTGAIGGKVGRAVRIPFRLLGAFDTFTRGIGGEAELAKLAFRRANGNKAEAQKLINDPPADLLAAMQKAAAERTFQNPNRLADSIVRLRSDHKWLHVVMPFVQTPANIASLTIQRSPAGFVQAAKAYNAWRKATLSGADPAELARLKGEAVDKMARPLVGTMILGTFAAIAKAGGMTGSGPTNPKERNELRNSGWQAYSFRVGDTYIPYNRFEPLSSILGLAADMIEAKDQKTAGDLADKALGSIIQNLTSKTYLQGLADAAAAISDPKQFAGQYVSNLAGSVVPNVVAKAAQAIDPAVRDVRPESGGLASIPERIGKTVASRLPGVSMTLDQRRGGTGEPIERPGNAVTRLLLPVQPSTEGEGAEFSKLLVDIEAVPSTPRKEIAVKGRKVRLTDEEYASLQMADEKTTKELRKLSSGAGFKRLDQERQRQIIENAYNKGRADARNRILKSTAFRGRLSTAPKEGK